jgi:hypothetical protein
MAQWYCSVVGQQYGPISVEQLAAWIQQGRVERDDMVWRKGMAEWQKAGSVAELSGLFATDIPPIRDRSPKRRHAPHRGGVVLALGVLGLVTCFICGIFAWVMGNEDLRRMGAGAMDPSGRGLTEAGKICGMISVILGIIFGGLWLVFFLMGVITH